MKYLGDKSLSSVLYRVLHVSWYFVLFGAISISFFIMVGMFSAPVEEPGATPMSQMKFELFNEMKKDAQAWEFFTKAPVAAKVAALFYMGALAVLLLQILKKGRLVFQNFKKNIVFNEENVRTISAGSKLLVVFSIMTFNIPSLLVACILLILSDVFKNGAVLQSEHDLTV